MYKGRAKEGLISVGTTQGQEPDPLDPEIIQRLDNRFRYQDIPDDYYKDEGNDKVGALGPLTFITDTVNAIKVQPILQVIP